MLIIDKINIKNLEIFARHGVFPEEKIAGQKFIISTSLYLDLREAGKSDSLGKTVDYGVICDGIRSFTENNTFDLIETLAESLAEKLLIENPAVQKVWIEVNKPDAPIDMPLETVSVEIQRERHRAYIALGSNMGDREAFLRFATDRLKAQKGCNVLKISNFIITKPYGDVEQDDFLNGCLELDTLLTPKELLRLLHDIENEAGRVHDLRWGPRTLDLDIIFYDDTVMSGDYLTIPHPEMHKRDFVLAPLCEIAPNLIHPVLRKTVTELLEELCCKP